MTISTSLSYLVGFYHNSTFIVCFVGAASVTASSAAQQRLANDKIAFYDDDRHAQHTICLNVLVHAAFMLSLGLLGSLPCVLDVRWRRTEILVSQQP